MLHLFVHFWGLAGSSVESGTAETSGATTLSFNNGSSETDGWRHMFRTVRASDVIQTSCHLISDFEDQHIILTFLCNNLFSRLTLESHTDITLLGNWLSVVTGSLWSDWLAPFRPSGCLSSVEAADFTAFLFGSEDRLVENVEGLMFKRRKKRLSCFHFCPCCNMHSFRRRARGSVHTHTHTTALHTHTHTYSHVDGSN